LQTSFATYDAQYKRTLQSADTFKHLNANVLKANEMSVLYVSNMQTLMKVDSKKQKWKT